MSDQASTTVPLIVKSSLVQKDSPSSKNNKEITETVAATVEAPSVESASMVYVGNLAFRTKEHGLAAFFEPIGKVLNCKIVTTVQYLSKRRSAGYGFIAFATMEEALKAAEELNKKVLNGREIVVEVARSKPRIVYQPQVMAPTYSTSANAHRRISENEQDDADTRNTDNSTQLDSASVASEEKPLIKYPRRRRKWFRRRPNKPMTPTSPATIFVSNLPYSSTDDTLMAIFKDYQVKSACVVRTPYGRSTGYGFVEMISSQERTKALASVKNVELEGRWVRLQVARSQGPRPQTINSNDDDNGGDPEAAAKENSIPTS